MFVIVDLAILNILINTDGFCYVYFFCYNRVTANIRFYYLEFDNPWNYE